MATHRSHVIRQVRPEDAPAAIAALVEAFDRDPIGQWLYPDAATRAVEHRKLFAGLLASPPAGTVAEMDGTANAVAIWHPPGTTLDLGPWPDATPVANEFFAAIRDGAPQAPFWYLAFIGARVSGTGAGTALLRHRLDRLDGTAALWTGNEANVAFYERFGFAVASRHDGDGATGWWMTRPAISPA